MTPRIWTILSATIILLLLSGAPEELLVRHVLPNYENQLAFGMSAIAAGFSLVVIVLVGPMKLVKAMIAGWPIVGFVLLAGVSHYWSAAPSLTLKATAHLTLFATASICLAAFTPWRELFLSAAIAGFLVGVLCVLLIPMGGLMTDPHPGALRGPWGEKNEAGMSLAFGALCFTALAFMDKKYIWLLGTVFLFGLTVLTKSTTSVSACVLGIVFMTGMELARQSTARLLITGWLGVVALGFFVFIFMTNPGDILAAAGEDTTLTGRSAIWPAVLERIQDRPWFGHGYASYWSDDAVEKLWLWMQIDFAAHNAHNAALETLLALGIVGLSLLAWAAIRGLLASMINATPNGDARRFAAPVILAILVVSSTESIVHGPDGLVWLAFITFTTRAAMRGTKDQMPTSNMRENAGRSRTLDNQAFVAGNPSRLDRVSPDWIWKPIKQSAAENS